MNYFYVLEGISCAGKTSTINCLEKKGAYIIRENVTFCNDFPPLPTNYIESRRNEKFILELEKKRCNIAEGRDGLSVADRMIISSMAISYAWDYGTIHNFIQDIIMSIRNTDNLLLCDCNFYLDVKYEDVIERNKKRRSLLGKAWVGENIIKRQRYFYDVYKDIVRSENWYDINSSVLSTEQISEIIISTRIERQHVTKEQRIEEFIKLDENI